MKLREIMTKNVVRIRPDEPVAVAARALAQYNIGALPVCGYDGRLRGLVTDRDIVTRCLAAGRNPGSTTVAEVMTGRIVAGRPDMETSAAAENLQGLDIQQMNELIESLEAVAKQMEKTTSAFGKLFVCLGQI